MSTKHVLLGLLIVVVFGVGFMIGRFSSVGNTYISGPSSAPATTNADDSTGDTASEEGTVIQASSISDGQKKLLGALGIDANSINVTPEMIACAETNLGSARVNEITNGATPSFSEGLKLAGCYKSSIYSCKVKRVDRSIAVHKWCGLA